MSLNLASSDLHHTEDAGKALFARARTDPTSRDRLVQIYLPVAESLARRFAGRGVPLDDLTQIASIGLLNAIERFDTSRGLSFSAFATPTIIGVLKHHFRDCVWSARVPRALQERGARVGDATSEASQRLGRSPTISDLADATDLSRAEVVEALGAGHAYRAGSLDVPAGDRGESAGDRLADGKDQFASVEAWAVVRPLMMELPERDRRILYHRYVEGLSQSQIGVLIGVSQMHVSRLLSRSLRSLRETAAA
jgi:RNA polymerase sigma-B factor